MISVISLPLHLFSLNLFFSCFLIFGLHKNFQGIVINLWWLRVPAPMRAGHICFCSSCNQGPEANFTTQTSFPEIWCRQLLSLPRVQGYARSLEPFPQEAAASVLQLLPHSLHGNTEMLSVLVMGSIPTSLQPEKTAGRDTTSPSTVGL